MEIHHSLKETWLKLFFLGEAAFCWTFGLFLRHFPGESCAKNHTKNLDPKQKKKQKKTSPVTTSFPIHFMLWFSSFQIFGLNPQAVLVLKKLKKFSAEGTDLKGGTKGQDIGFQGSWRSRCIRVSCEVDVFSRCFSSKKNGNNIQ